MSTSALSVRLIKIYWNCSHKTCLLINSEFIYIAYELDENFECLEIQRKQRKDAILLISHSDEQNQILIIILSENK